MSNMNNPKNISRRNSKADSRESDAAESRREAARMRMVSFPIIYNKYTINVHILIVY